MHMLGYNYRLTDIQAALGISQLNKLEKFIKRRREIAECYNEQFRDVEEVLTPSEAKGFRSSYHLYVVRLNSKVLDRKRVFAAMRGRGIGVQVHYIPVHLQPFYKEKYGYKEGDFPVAEQYYKSAISLPIYPQLTDKQIRQVVKSLKQVIRESLSS